MSIQLQFTNNFYAWLSSILLSNTTDNGTSFSTGILSDGTYPTKMLGSMTLQNGSQGRNVIVFRNDNFSEKVLSLGLSTIGAPNTPVTFKLGSGTPNDHSLGSELSNIAISTTGVHYVDGTEGVLDISLSVTNNNASAVSISEIGLFKAITEYYYWSGTRFYPTETYLFAYGVFDTALEIGAGNTKTFTAQLRLPIVAPSA